MAEDTMAAVNAELVKPMVDPALISASAKACF